MNISMYFYCYNGKECIKYESCVKMRMPYILYTFTWLYTFEFMHPALQFLCHYLLKQLEIQLSFNKKNTYS